MKNTPEKSQQIFREFLEKAAASEERTKTAEPIDFQQEDLEITKSAGIMIYDATAEGIEQFIKEYLINEFAFFPDKVDISVELNPTNVSSPSHVNYAPQITDAQGIANVVYNGAVIGLPFIVRDKELMPFDTISLNGQQAIYSRENIKKILYGIQAQAAGTQTAQGMNPYQGVDKSVNSLTDLGFMNDVLKIQELATNFRSTNASEENTEIEKVASGGFGFGFNKRKNKRMFKNDDFDGILDYLMEKSASLKPLNINYDEVRKNIRAEYLADAEKLASYEAPETEIDTLIKQAFVDNIKDLRLTDVSKLKNGARITYPEKDGHGINMVKAVVVKTLLNGRGLSMDRHLVISSDCRFADLKHGQRFLGVLDSDISWNLPVKNLEGINPGRKYTLSVNGVYMLPFVVTKVCLGSAHNLKMAFIYHCMDADGNKFTIASDPDLHEKTVSFKHKKLVMGRIAANEAAEKLVYYDMYLKRDLPIISLPPNTEVIELEGAISDPVTEKQALLFTYDEEIMKTASSSEYVQATLVSRGNPTLYDVDIVWIDRKNNIPAEHKTHFKNVSEGKVKGIFRTIGFSFTECAEAIIRAEREGKAFFPIRPQHTPWIVQPDKAAAGVTESVINQMRESFFNRENALKAASAVTGAALGGILMYNKGIPSSVIEAVKGLSSFASASAATARKLEKIAIKTGSEDLAKIAKTMVLKHRIDKMVKDTLEYNKEYDGLEVMSSLIKIKPMLSKMATELIDVRQNQIIAKSEIIPNSYITSALRGLDGLNKYAAAFDDRGDVFASFKKQTTADNSRASSNSGTPSYEPDSGLGQSDSYEAFYKRFDELFDSNHRDN